jgi:hypothetical protein
MADDFRNLLKEDLRNKETGERWFEDLELGEVFFFSVQASALHGSSPAALLDSVMDYEAFQVTIQSKPKVSIFGRKGAWQHLETKPWWPLFVDDTPLLYVAENVPVATVQQIFEDLTACVAEHPELTPKEKCACGLKPC